MKIEFAMFVSLIAVGLAGCAGNRAVSHGQVANTWNDASDATTLRFRGLGVPPATATSTTQRMALARAAAQADARTQALAYLKGLTIKGDIRVKDAMMKNSDVHELVNKTIAGLVEERVQWLNDGGCLVVMSIDRKLVDQMLAQTQAEDAASGSTAEAQ